MSKSTTAEGSPVINIVATLWIERIPVNLEAFSRRKN